MVIDGKEVWPEWQLVRKLGQGSFGTVYEAVRKDHQVESRAAIKVISVPQNLSELDSLRAEGFTDANSRTYLEGIVDNFVGEIQMMESFKGTQNIVSVEDYKVVTREPDIGWTIYIRMELLTPLNEYLRDHTLDENKVIQLGEDICSALELCSQCNVIHRDIKPENIFANSFGSFKLGDFGIARQLENVTMQMSQKGTYSYMAPEVIKGDNYNATVDIYSLGLVLYRFLNQNRMPFLSPDQVTSPRAREEAIQRRLSGEPLPVPCNASPAMAGLILCACAPDPAQRFASASDMKHALQNLKNAAAGTGSGDTVLARKPLMPGQNPSFQGNEPQWNMPRTERNSESQWKTVRIQPPESSGRETQTTGRDSKQWEEQPVRRDREQNYDRVPKKSNAPKVAIAILSVCLLLAVSVTAFLILRDRDDSSADSSTDSSEEDSSEYQIEEPMSISDEMISSGSTTEADLIAENTVYLTGWVKVASNGNFFLEWDEPVSILFREDDGSETLLKDITSTYLNNVGIRSDIWALLPYDDILRFGGSLRLDNHRLYLDAMQLTDINGNELESNTVDLGNSEPSTEPNYETPDYYMNYYLLPTNTQYITAYDLSSFTREEVVLIRNELYARHGCIFRDNDIQSYFDRQVWYYPVAGYWATSFNAADFNIYESKNLNTIIQYEKDMGWK